MGTSLATASSVIYEMMGSRQSAADLVATRIAGVSPKTRAQTNWYLSVWKEWAKEHNI